MSEPIGRRHFFGAAAMTLAATQPGSSGYRIARSSRTGAGGEAAVKPLTGAAGPLITVPTITLEGDANGAPHPEASSCDGKFSGRYTHRVLDGGIGHNLPQEASESSAKAVIDVDTN